MSIEERGSTPFEGRTVSVETAAAWGRAPGAGERVGRYRLTRVLGEGGFGIVYEAEQTEPVRRSVALKLIRPGMDSAAVVGRFEAERQALAVLDHPCIAKVLDAGTSGAESTRPGLPFFVMELVRGEPIDAYCDRRRLNVEERLALFARVCDAVQHAHMKGVIHRDLKPGNILVGEEDGEPRPRVIDFGIAKALGSSALRGDAMMTEQGAIVGTPEYMSPEQAGLGGQDIDTRADVYSLGVVLYELLCGSLPFDPKRLRSGGMLEAARVICEQPVPRPSTRLSEQRRAEPATADRAAAERAEEPRRLVKRLRGDLDQVVMTCLSKDRAARYLSAAALAEDVRRFLEGLPVRGAPSGACSRFDRFVRRHERVIAVGLFLLALQFAIMGVAFLVSPWLDQKDSAVQLVSQLAAFAMLILTPLLGLAVAVAMLWHRPTWWRAGAIVTFLVYFFGLAMMIVLDS